MGSLLAARVPWIQRPAVSSRRLFFFFDEVFFIIVPEFGGLCAFRFNVVDYDPLINAKILF